MRQEQTDELAAAEPAEPPRDTHELLRARHPSTIGVARFLLDVNPRLPADLAHVAELFAHLTRELLSLLADGPELTAGLRKLLEAKDCAVRSALPTT